MFWIWVVIGLVIAALIVLLLIFIVDQIGKTP